MFKKLCLSVLMVLLMVGLATAEYDVTLIDMAIHFGRPLNRLQPEKITDDGLIAGRFRARAGTSQPNTTWVKTWPSLDFEVIMTMPGGGAWWPNDVNEFTSRFDMVILGPRDIWTNSSGWTVLPTPPDYPGENYWYYGLNEAGVNVGYVGSVGFIKNGINWTYVSYTGADYTTLLDINNNNQIIGYYQLPGSPSKSFLYENGVFTDIILPDVDLSHVRAISINDNGDVAGWYNHISDPNSKGFVWNGEVVSTITGFTNLKITNINNNRTVVGTVLTPSDGYIFVGEYIPEIIFYDVIISSPGIGNGGYTDYDGTQSIEENTVLTITAFPEPGFEFTGWIGAPAGQENDNPLIITINSNVTLTATFGNTPVDINVEFEPEIVYINNDKNDDILSLKSKQAVDLLLENNEIVETEIIIRLKGKGVYGGDLVLKGIINPEVNGNGQVLK